MTFARWAVAAVCLLLVASCHRSTKRTQTAAPAKTTAPRGDQITTEEGCRACNGVWGQHGMAEVLSCICRTGDAGKPCRQKEDCEGECLADTAQVQIVDTGPPVRGYVVGKCSDLEQVFGCKKRLMRGQASRGPYDLAPPIPEMCVD
jgi:hypothetical protein